MNDDNNSYMFVCTCAIVGVIFNYFLVCSLLVFCNNYSIQLQTMCVSTARKRTRRMKHKRNDVDESLCSKHSTDLTTVFCSFVWMLRSIQLRPKQWWNVRHDIEYLIHHSWNVWNSVGRSIFFFFNFLVSSIPPISVYCDCTIFVV